MAKLSASVPTASTITSPQFFSASRENSPAPLTEQKIRHGMQNFITIPVSWFAKFSLTVPDFRIHMPMQFISSSSIASVAATIPEPP